MRAIPQVQLLILLMPFLLLGCSGDQGDQRVSPAPSRAISSDTTATAQELFGDRVQSVFVEEAALNDGGTPCAFVSVRLSSEEPTGTEPYVLLASLIRRYPDKGYYGLSASMPDGVSMSWGWTTRTRSIDYHSVIRREGRQTHANAQASDIDTATIEEIAEGTRPLPELR